MRILLTLGTSTGGVGTHVRALARDLARGHTVTIAAPESTIAHFSLDASASDGGSVIPWNISTRIHPRDVRSIRELRRHIDRLRPDVIHAHGFRAALLTLLARGRTGAPVVASWHNQASATGLKGLVERRVEAFIARRADLTIGASEDLVRRARELGSPNAVFAPVAAPQPTPVSQEQAMRLRQEFGDRGTLLGLMVGRVAPQKNYDLAIDIAANLRDLPVHILIAGAADAEVLRRLQARLEHADLGSARISFLGQRGDVSVLMEAADFYLLTSHWEARALVVQEALLAGLPIVASAVGGIVDLVGDSGVLIDPEAPDSAEQFARAISDFALPTDRGHWSRLARARGEALPDEQAVASTLQGHYEQLLARG